VIRRFLHYLFKGNGTGLVFRCQGRRIKRCIGKPVGIALGKMKGHPDHAFRHLRRYLCGDTHFSPSGRGRNAGFPAPPAQIPSMRNYRTGLLPQVMTHRRFCCLPYLAKPTLQGFPALCPAPVLLDRFPLVSPLFSASSAIRLLSRILFKGILDTIRLSDFRKPFIPVVRFSPSLAVPHRTRKTYGSPDSRVKNVHTCQVLRLRRVDL